MSKGSKEVLVQLLNPSSFPIVLHKQEVVGTLHPLDEHNSMHGMLGWSGYTGEP